MFESSPSPRPWVQRACAEIACVRSADALLGFLLEYLSSVSIGDRELLTQLVVAHGRFLDPRVLSVLVGIGYAHRLVGECTTLSVEAAEWFATYLVGTINIPPHWMATRYYRECVDSLRQIVGRYRLSARSLPGLVLFNEANVRQPAQRNDFTRGALERYLFFGDVDEDRLASLARVWKGDIAGEQAIANYRVRRAAQ